MSLLHLTIAEKDGCFRIAAEDNLNREIGHAYLHWQDQAGEVSDVWVEPEARRKGCARQMVEALLVMAKGNRLERVTAHVNEDNTPSMRLFREVLGFQPQASERHLEKRLA